jgi:hypothetical protein
MDPDPTTGMCDRAARVLARITLGGFPIAIGHTEALRVGVPDASSKRMPATNSSYDELRPILDGVDDTVIARIVDTGASVDEVAEAVSYLEAHENGEGLVEDVSSPRVLEVRAILAEVRPADDDHGSN